MWEKRGKKMQHFVSFLQQHGINTAELRAGLGSPPIWDDPKTPDHITRINRHMDYYGKPLSFEYTLWRTQDSRRTLCPKITGIKPANAKFQSLEFKKENSLVRLINLPIVNHVTGLGFRNTGKMMRGETHSHSALLYIAGSQRRISINSGAIIVTVNPGDMIRLPPATTWAVLDEPEIPVPASMLFVFDHI